MSKNRALIIICLLTQQWVLGQSGLDSFVKRLDNKDAQIGFMTRIFTAEEITGVKNPAPKIKPHGQVLSIDVDSLAALYPRDLLVKKLVPLLKDTNKDFYANSILYALFEREMPPLNTRDNWLKTTRKKDIQHWNEYAREKGLTL